ncbi:MAG: Holliday junction resolvase RuvX [Promicromonosporaceae bacterium]|nr:Holliday junction resolvase RuvX [Promicromonosporaceae bacterium]
MSDPVAPATLPRGRRLGVDVGKVRIGVALSDPDGLLAMPVETVARDLGGQADIERLRQLVAENEVAVVYLGLPRHLNGTEGAAADDARGFAARLLAAEMFPAAVFLVDERLTTVTSQQDLHASGRSAKSQRLVIDQQAAVIILQSALDFERRAGRRAGEPTHKETSP